MTRITRSALSSLGCLLAVSGVLAEPPVVTQVEPKQGFVDADTAVAIHGAGFEPQAKVALLPGPVGVSTPGYAGSVAVAGHYAYVADGDLQIVDIHNPAAPVLVATVDNWGDLGQAVAVSGTYAYVAGSLGGCDWWGYCWCYRRLAIVDVSEPAAPRLVSESWEELGGGSCEGPTRGISVAGNDAYVTLASRWSRGVEVIDVSSPSAPSHVTWLDFRGYTPNDVSVSGGYAFVALGDAGLDVIDVSEPASPSLVASFVTPGSANGVAISGTRVFVAGGDSGLSIVDVSNLAAPSLIGIVDTPGFAGDVAVAGDTAFVADGAEGVQMIDVSNPAAPAITGHCDTPGDGVGVAVSGEYALVADGSAGLQITDGACAEAVVGASAG